MLSLARKFAAKANQEHSVDTTISMISHPLLLNTRLVIGCSYTSLLRKPAEYSSYLSLGMVHTGYFLEMIQ